MTIGALIGMAAHLDGVHVTVLDQMGLSQKGGSVFSHIRLAAGEEALHGLHVGRGDADLVLACDMVVAASKEGLATVGRGATRVVLNTLRDADRRFRARYRHAAAGGAAQAQHHRRRRRRQR